MTVQRKPRPVHHPEDFGLNVLESEDDMFRWFLLTFMLGKPIQSTVAVNTWRLFIERGYDNPWALIRESEGALARLLVEGKYTRYNHVMAKALHIMAQQLIDKYDGSLAYLLSVSDDDMQCTKFLTGLYGVGPKTAEIFMREVDEYFARRSE